MKKRTSITTQLMLRIIPLVMILMVIVVSTVMKLTDTAVRQMVKSELKKEAYGNEKVLTRFISDAFSNMEPIKDTLENVAFKNDDERFTYMKTTTELNDSIPGGVYIGDDKGHFQIATGWVPDADYSVTDRDWYKEGKTHEEFALGIPYLDAQTGQMVVSISSKVKSPGWGNSVLVADMHLEKISEFISDLTVMKAGYSFVVAPMDNMVIAHKDTKYNGMALDEAAAEESILSNLQEKLADTSNLDTVLTINAPDGNYMIVAEPVENTSWYLVSCVPEDVVLNKLYDLLLKISVVAIILTILILVVITFSIQHKTKPIKKLTSIIESITSGDFTVEVLPTGHNEITTMSEKLKLFIENMRETIIQLTHISKQLLEQSANSAEVSQILEDSTTIQSNSMGQLNTTVDELAHSIESIAENATSLAEAVGVVFNNGNEAEERVTETVTATEKGKHDIEKVASNMDKINASIEVLEKTVREVGESTGEINNITGIIGDIAGQTNLLALNASIEAARAGEAGRGFAVVADEIGTLANMSADAVKKISDLINKINHQVESTMIQTGQSVSDIRESKKLADVSYETFMEIYDKIITTDKNIKNVTAKIREVEDVASSMAALTEEQSASTEEILATSENLYEQSQNIAENSHEVQNMAGNLKTTAETIENRIREFKA